MEVSFREFVKRTHGLQKNRGREYAREAGPSKHSYKRRKEGEVCR